jgi:hypothetical protein
MALPVVLIREAARRRWSYLRERCARAAVCLPLGAAISQAIDA